MVTDEVARLQEQVRELKRQVRRQQEALERKNKELDALHYVWCSGGCDGGVHRYTREELTREIVEEAIRNTTRLAAWYGNVEFGHLELKDRFEYIERLQALRAGGQPCGGS